MTEQQFKEFAERIVSEDVTRPAMRSAFRYKGHSIVTDARIALVVDTAFESLPEAADGQESLAVSLVEQMLPDIRRKICDGKYGAMPLDADLLARRRQRRRKTLRRTWTSCAITRPTRTIRTTSTAKTANVMCCRVIHG